MHCDSLSFGAGFYSFFRFKIELVKSENTKVIMVSQVALSKQRTNDSSQTLCSIGFCHDIRWTKGIQPVALVPHLAREVVMCDPQGLFARSISSWKSLTCFAIKNRGQSSPKFWDKFPKNRPKSQPICGKDLFFRFFGLHLNSGVGV